MNYRKKWDGKGWPDGHDHCPATPNVKPPTKRPPKLSARTRKRLIRLLMSQDGTCFHCNQRKFITPLNIVLVVPISIVGSRTLRNEVASCISCNTAKSDRMPTAEELDRKAVINAKYFRK